MSVSPTHTEAQLRDDLKQAIIELAIEQGWSYSNGINIRGGASRTFIRNHEIIWNTHKGWKRASYSKVLGEKLTEQYGKLVIFDGCDEGVYGILRDLLDTPEVDPMPVYHQFYKEGFERPMRLFESANHAPNKFFYDLGVADSEGGKGNECHDSLEAFIAKFGPMVSANHYKDTIDGLKHRADENEVVYIKNNLSEKYA